MARPLVIRPYLNTRPSWLRDLGGILAHFDLVLWFVSLLAAPFYLFPSGMPQPGDFPAFLLIAYLAVKNRLEMPKGSRNTLLCLLLFLGWVIVVSAFWMVHERNAVQRGVVSYLIPLFYVYNTLVFVAGLGLYQRYGDRFLRYTFLGIAWSVILLVILSPLRMGGVRSTLFFNNPNQLGYYALSSATLLILLAPLARVKKSVLTVALACAFYLTLLSLSKSAMAGFGSLLVIALISPRIGFRSLFPLMIGLLVIVGIGLATPMGERLITQPLKRLESLSKLTGEDSLTEDRGYYRITKYPELTVLGAGEGYLHRFTGQFGGREIHSTWGTILFSYGIPGSILFFGFLYFIHRPGGWQSLLIMSPNLVYGFHHQGLRATLFWIMALAVLVSGLSYQRLAHNARQGRREPESALAGESPPG